MTATDRLAEILNDAKRLRSELRSSMSPALLDRLNAGVDGLEDALELLDAEESELRRSARASILDYAR